MDIRVVNILSEMSHGASVTYRAQMSDGFIETVRAHSLQLLPFSTSPTTKLKPQQSLSIHLTNISSFHEMSCCPFLVEKTPLRNTKTAWSTHRQKKWRSLKKLAEVPLELGTNVAWKIAHLSHPSQMASRQMARNSRATEAPDAVRDNKSEAPGRQTGRSAAQADRNQPLRSSFLPQMRACRPRRRVTRTAHD
jgi:hypothetical protein